MLGFRVEDLMPDQPRELTSQQIDAAVKLQMGFHLADSDAAHIGEPATCKQCGDEWPCAVIVQGTISLKLTAIANILAADQAAIIQGIVNNGNPQNPNRR